MIEDNLEAEQAVFGVRSIPERQQIILYELGMVTRSLLHGASSTSILEQRAELANAMVELSDVVLQLAMLHDQMLVEGLRLEVKYLPAWDELIEDGAERQLERMKEWEKRRNTQW